MHTFTTLMCKSYTSLCSKYFLLCYKSNDNNGWLVGHLTRMISKFTIVDLFCASIAYLFPYEDEIRY